MNNLRYTKEELSFLRELCSSKIEKLVWDINAFYFNLKDYAIKLECYSDSPDGSDYKYDEINFTRIIKQDEKYEFNNDEAGKWYKIIDENVEILDIQIASFYIKYPEEKLIVPENNIEVEEVKGLNCINSGIILKTEKGYIPALLEENNFGFDWSDRFEYFSESDLESLKKKDLRNTKFEPFNCK